MCVCLCADEAMDKLNNSVRVHEVDPNDFVALFVPGGHGKRSLPTCTLHTLYGIADSAVCSTRHRHLQHAHFSTKTCYALLKRSLLVASTVHS